MSTFRPGWTILALALLAPTLSAQDAGHPLERIGPVAARDEVLALKDAVQRVRIADEIRHYVVELVRRTRAAPQVQLGCGPRASIADPWED